MSSQPIMTGACRPKSDDSVTQLRLEEGHTVGIISLGVVLGQLLAMGRAPRPHLHRTHVQVWQWVSLTISGQWRSC